MVEHVAIQDADRHEVKHASTAVLNQVLKSNGDGTTSFGFVNYSEIAGKPAAAGYRQVLYGSSVAASQQPSATNTPLQIEFGPAQTFTSASLAANGTITFNEPGDYLVNLFLRFGRTSGAGNAIMFNRFLVNGAQSLNSNSITLPDQNVTIPFSASLLAQVAAGTTFTIQIYRDSAGINNGGLFQTSPSLGGWNVSPSASVQVLKFIGAV